MAMSSSSSSAMASSLLLLRRCCSRLSLTSQPSLSPSTHAANPARNQPGGGTNLPLPFLLSSVRHYAKRAKKWQGGPYVWLPVPREGEQVPPSRPNEGSVKNRNHQKRMAQRAAFAKLQAHTRKEQQKAANILRDANRRKRWKEGAERARAWAQLQADRAAGTVPVLV